jgi:hypothetical protein
MEHKPYAEMSRVADVRSGPSKPAMTRRERMERWAEVLEREPTRELKSLEEIEWKSRAERRAIRADGSPLTVAFEDPVLRAEGLASDRLGDAFDFFELSVHDAHFALCSCVYGRTMQASVAAYRVRHLATRESSVITNLSVVGDGIVALLLMSGLAGLIH